MMTSIDDVQRPMTDDASRAKGQSPTRILWCQVVLMLSLLAYVGVVRAIEGIWGLQSVVGWLPSLVLVLVPAAIWLVYFYLLDRYEPEPTHFVLSAFLLGALVAAPISSWIINDLFTVDRWISLSPFSAEHIGASFLVIGAAQELTKYVVIRYTVYLSDEFDEPADGIVYTTAAGIGFATALNFEYVSSGVLPTIGAINVTITTLAHACFAGAVGYALGVAKFAGRGGQRVLILGLLAAVGLNGVFFLLQDLVVRPGIDLKPWRGLILCGVFAVVVFGVISYLMRRSLRASAPPAGAAGTGAAGTGAGTGEGGGA
jgi:RsiW-degrading membrane proteinase PrsW (M82 family)